ncbi:MAG: nitrogenase [Desulfovibrio sp.]|nr:MAG: nitrogenase [Desulfovibrio sp.]
MAESYVSTTNACKLCTPLGAALAFKGVQGAVPFLHGSQGCATYMRRYVISHFREPVDIASSALGEKHAVYGGGPNLKQGILNVMKKYSPALVGVASTCLTETIGDDVPMLLAEFRREFSDLNPPELVHVSTPSYMGTHTDGWRNTVLSLTRQLCTETSQANETVNVFPTLCSCEDLRIFKAMFREYGLTPVILPDYSDTLDGPALAEYEPIPAGGTPIAAIKAMSGATASLDLGRCLPKDTAGADLETRFGVDNLRLGMPMGLRESDAMHHALSRISGKDMPKHIVQQRGRLVDALVDGHKYVSGARAVVYGEEDLVAGLASFLTEVGIDVVLAATGSEKCGLDSAVREVTEDLGRVETEVRMGVDFHEIAERAGQLKPDLLVGHSKGYRYAREWNIPLVRVGFPVHDRFGAQRIATLGYTGAQQMFDRIVNAVLDKRQADSPVGYGYQ